MQAQRPWSRSG